MTVMTVTRLGRLLARVTTSLGTTRMSPSDQNSATGLVMLVYWYTGGETRPHLTHARSDYIDIFTTHLAIFFWGLPQS